MVQYSQDINEELSKQTLSFCRHVAGSCQITAACMCGDYALGLMNSKTPVEVLLVIRGFQPRFMNYVKVFDKRNIVVNAVDQWVFERDVDRGFLGEALAGGLMFPYIALANWDYLHAQEIKLKKRLVIELLESLVLDFPELSYDVHIKPEYFVYETLLSRARLYPPMIYYLLNFMRGDVADKNVGRVLHGYLEALKALEREEVVSFSSGYFKISRDFADSVRGRRVRFVSLLKGAQKAQKALFTSLLGILPRFMSLLSQNREVLLRLQRIAQANSESVRQVEDPQKYLCVPTAGGLVPLSNRMDIEAFARKVLSVSAERKVRIEEIGGVLNNVYLIKASVNGVERKVVVKSFKDWSSFKWFPLTLWTIGTRTFAVSGLSRLEKECAINQFLDSKGFAVPKVLHVSPSERLVFMEYVEGENLEKAVRRVLSSKDAGRVEKELGIIGLVGEIFAEIHALGISLGDTKPENMMVGKKGEIFMLDFEQASRNGDKVWDVAEFLYYAGHYATPFVGAQVAELVARAFIEGYLKAGGDVRIVKRAANPKYTKVFSIFTLPHIMLTISSVCRKADKLKKA